MARRNPVFISWIIAFCLAALVSVQGASAHALDSGLAVEAVPVGPFHLTVWSVPSSSDGPQLHLTAMLSDPETGSLVQAARLDYRVVGLQAGQPAIARHFRPATPANGFLFEADARLPEFGSYRITVIVNEGQAAGGEVTFLLPVYPQPAFLKVLITLLLGLGIGTATWLLREGWTIVMKNRSLK